MGIGRRMFCVLTVALARGWGSGAFALFLGLVVVLFSTGCAARPLDVPTGSLPVKCATFARPGAIFLNLTCASKEPDKPTQ